MRRRSELLWRHQILRGGDVKRIEGCAAERDAGRIKDRNWHNSVNASVRRKPHDPATVPLRVPDAAIGVNARAVRQTWLPVELGKNLTIADRATLYVVVERPDLPRRRISEV